MKMLLLLTLAASAGHVLAESAIPKAYDRERYEGTTTESPFALETPKVEEETKEAPVNVLTDLYITGLTQFEGKDLVMVKGVSDSQGITLVGNEPYRSKGPEDLMGKYDGVYVERVHWSDRWLGVKVDLAHGAQGSILRRQGVEFKRDQSAVAGAPRMQMFGQQNAPGAQGGPGRRFGQPGATTTPSLIPTGLNPANQPRPGSTMPGGSRQNNLTPGAPRPGGTQAFPGTGASVPRPGGQFQRGNNGGNGATTNAPNTGPSRTRDRGGIGNGGGGGRGR